MKRSLQLLIVFSVLFLSIPFQIEAATLPNVEAKSYILIDYETGAILAEKSKDQPREPASMTKMMSQFIILDKIKAKELTWDEEATVSERAAAIDEAQIDLVAGEKVTIRELFIAMVVQSANDATVVLAEHVAGSEEDFVKLMNEKAKSLGMKNTTYCNASGLNKENYPDPPKCSHEHLMSAEDSAILAKELLKAHPEIIETTSIARYTFGEGTAREKSVVNWNKMLPGLPYEYEGVDGFKTGHTNAAGYCFTGTAKKSDFRVISVVMGTASERERFSETEKLLDFAFENYQLRELVGAGKAVKGKERLPLPNGVERDVPIAVKEQVLVPVEIGKEKNYTLKIKMKPDVKAPLKKGDVVGTVEVQLNGKPIEGMKPVELVTTQEMEEGSWIRLFFRSIIDEVSSWF